MGTLNVRLTRDLEEWLAREAREADKPRSELARQAIREYLERMERERFMEDLGRAARTIATDPELRREATAMAEEFESSEGESAGGPEQGTEEPWWR